MVYDVKIPLLGFENIKKMTLEKVDDIFMKLDDYEKSGISFTLIDPFAIREYEFDLPKDDAKKLDITKESELLIYNIMIIQNPIENSTINFLAPLIFNKSKKIMGQIVLDNNIYKDYGIIEYISNYLS